MTKDKVQSGKVISGKIVSVSMQKTVVVDIERSKTHRLYGKSYRVNSKIKAHNEFLDAKVGDSVIITETRPISKEVSFKVIKLG